MRKLNETTLVELSNTLERFCNDNDIGPPNDFKTMADTLVKLKGKVYYETFQTMLLNWTAGKYELIKKPRKLNVHFLSQIVETYFQQFRSDSRTTHFEYNDPGVTPEIIDQRYQDGYARVLSQYEETFFGKHTELMSLIFLSTLYDWMLDNEMLDPTRFDDEDIRQKQIYLLEWHNKFQMMGHNDIIKVVTPTTIDSQDLTKAAYVALEMDTIIIDKRI